MLVSLIVYLESKGSLLLVIGHQHRVEHLICTFQNLDLLMQNSLNSQ